MNESRQQQILAGQSSIAQKVFTLVPIQAAWSNHEIHGAAITAKATGASPYAIRRALGELPPEGETDSQAYFDREIVAVDNGMQEVMAFHEGRRAAMGKGEQS